MTTSQNWQAAMLVVDIPSIANRIDDYCDKDQETIDPSILELGWSGGERRLIELPCRLIRRSR